MTYSYTWLTKCLHIHILIFDFYIPSLLSVKKLQINIKILVSELNIWAKFEFFQTGISENGTIHITMMKNWASHIFFLRKRGFIVYLAALKKGAIRAAHPYYVIYRVVTLPPPPRYIRFIPPTMSVNLAHYEIVHPFKSRLEWYTYHYHYWALARENLSSSL